MLNSYVCRNVPRCRTRWTMEVKKNKEIRETSQEAQYTANRFYRKRE